MGDIYGKLLAVEVKRNLDGDVNRLVVHELGDVSGSSALIGFTAEADGR